MAVQSFLAFGNATNRGPVASIVDYLLLMLDKDVVDNCKTCCEYFEFFKNYASYVSIDVLGRVEEGGGGSCLVFREM